MFDLGGKIERYGLHRRYLVDGLLFGQSLFLLELH